MTAPAFKISSIHTLLYITRVTRKGFNLKTTVVEYGQYLSEPGFNLTIFRGTLEVLDSPNTSIVFSFWLIQLNASPLPTCKLSSSTKS